MTQPIINAAPLVVELGTDDKSIRQLPREPESLPQHLPKFYIYAETGKLEPQLGSGNELIRMYGSNTFDPRSKHYNYSTDFLVTAMAEANSVVVQRIIPSDANKEAELTLYLDVLTLPNQDIYQRDLTGKYVLDSSNNKIVTGQSTVNYLFWYTLPYNGTATDFGTKVSIPGLQIDAASGLRSTSYPILTIKASCVGERSNLSGIRMWGPVSSPVNPLPTSLLNSDGAYPFYLSVIKKPDANSSAKNQYSILGESRILFTFKEGSIDPLTGTQLYLADKFVDSYNNLNDPIYPKLYGEFDKIAVYQENIDSILQTLHNSEKLLSLYGNDFSVSGPDKEKYLINFISCVNSENIEYNTIRLVDYNDGTISSIRLTEFADLLATGGSDGTYNNAEYNASVRAELQRYLDPLDPIQDIVQNPESIIYDTGFDVSTKLEIPCFIGSRKDTNIVLGTYVTDTTVLTTEQELSLGIMLNTRVTLFPESDYFGTPTMRASIFGFSCKRRNTIYKKRVPLTIEIMIKSCRYMGAGNGIWTTGQHFDGAPGSILDSVTDISVKWMPAITRNKFWDAGINWVQRYDRSQFFFPALKTVYKNDTSVLNSYLTVCAIAYLNKISHMAWREFTGVAHLTNDQLAARVDEFITNKVQFAFDDRFVIIPSTYFTDLDLARGFSWTTVIKIYASNMQTVMTTYVESYRLTDLPLNEQ